MKQSDTHLALKHLPKDKKSDFPYELTIAMIFRDDIKYIRNCLETMQILRDAIPCQLIMTDTGSIDGSREVVEEFADVIIDFEWCDDFSAARNTGIDRAEGRWFAYFDTDHDFDESILDIVRFLKSEESYTEECASLEIRNYQKEGDRHGYSTTSSNLLFNFAGGKKYFQGIIHEAIPRASSTAFVSTIVHHWGHTAKNKQDKLDRNQPLIDKILEEEPENMKNHLQNIVTTSILQERVKRIKNAIAICETVDHTAQIFYNTAFHIYHYMAVVEMGDLDKALEIETKTLELLEKLKVKAKSKKTNLDLEFLWARCLCYNRLKDVEECYRLLLEYQELYHHLKKTPDTVTSGVFVLRSLELQTYYDCETRCISLAIEKESDEIGKKLLQGTDCYLFRKEKAVHMFYQTYVKFVLHYKEYPLILKAYKTLMDNDSKTELKQLQSFLDNRLQTMEKEDEAEEREALLTAISKEPMDLYTAILQLRKKNFTTKAFTKKITSIITEEEDFYLNPHCGHLLYGYLLTGKDPLDYIQKCDSAVLHRAIFPLFRIYKNTVDLVEKAYANPDFTISSLKEEKLWAYLGLRGTLKLAVAEDEETQEDFALSTEEISTSNTLSDTMDSDRINKLFSQSVPLMCGYVNKVYNPYLLSIEGKGILPQEELFAVLAGEAMAAGNPLELIQKLKEAVIVCPSYSPIVDVFTNLFTELLSNT